jgi:glycosyltransferase involved in cell wall biosynthesis
MFSILILTLNEEVNLKACLASVAWCDDVVVLDSFSTDATVALAEAAGVQVVQRKFDDFAGQRNYALDSIAFKNQWVFHLDADERFTPELRRECEAVIAADRHSGYMVPSKLMFMDRWLRRAGMYPTYQMRLLKRGEVRFIQHGHGQREAYAKRGIGKLHEPYLHYNFSKGLADWFEKHNRYSSAEAALSAAKASNEAPQLAGLFSTNSVARRRALKHFSTNLPFRPALKFLYMYLFRLGFLDGIPGYHYCRMMAVYEYLIVVKTAELRRQSEQSRK